MTSTAVEAGRSEKLGRADRWASTEEKVPYLAASDYNSDEGGIICASSLHGIIKSFCKKGWAI